MNIENRTGSQQAAVAAARMGIEPLRVDMMQFGGGYRLPAPVKTDAVPFGGGYRLPDTRPSR